MFNKVKLILWKHYIIRKRHWFLTIVEVLMPVALFTLIAFVRSKVGGMNKVEIMEPTYFEPYSIDRIYQQLAVGEIKLWYTPSNNITQNLMRNVQLRFQIPNEDVRDFVSEDDLLKSYLKKSDQSIAAVVFHGPNTKHLQYDIRFHDKYLEWDTKNLFSEMQDSEMGGSKYIYKGFIALQMAINQAFIEASLGTNSLSNITFSLQELPYPPHTRDFGLSQMFTGFLPAITIFSFIFLCPAVLKRIVEEKVSGIKELMKMVGMTSWMIWLGWFTHALFTNVLSIIAIVFLMKVSLWGAPYPPIEFCDGFVLFVFLLLFCMAATSLCFMIAACFNKSSFAMLFGILVWILSYFIPKSLIIDSMLWRYKILVGLFPNMALQYGFSAISVYETREVGIHWNNLFQSGSNDENDVTMGNVFMLLILDTVLFVLLTVYIDNVNPGDYGIAKPLNFPFTSLKNTVKDVLLRKSSQVESEELRNLSNVEEGNKPSSSIQIKNLFKKYGPNVAVNNLSLNICKNSITILLGHNGAGKTTTMSVITGMTPATSGLVEINGFNIRHDIDKVRKNMGLCPQHNLLFPDLTVREHLIFFGMLKGVSYKVADQEANVLLENLNLDSKANSLAHTLSGGMKRKLCLGMSLIGDSKVLILDEPTSGMDPESRRKVWDMLLQMRKEKTILITTHFMEEADALGDYVAIMANGTLQCFGTPIELKNKFATGYHLSLMLRHKDGVKEIDRMIKNNIPGAKIQREHGVNVVYTLPLCEKNRYPNVFQTLEKQKDVWGVDQIGLTITTLNDVFLKARSEVVHDEEREHESIKRKGQASIIRKVLSLLLKRWYFLNRKWYWYIPGLVVAITLFLLTLWLSQMGPQYYEYGGPKLNLTLDGYGKPTVFYGSHDYPGNDLIGKMKNFYGAVVSNQQGIPIEVTDVSKEIIDKGIENIAHYKKHIIAAAEFNITDNGKEILVNAMYSPSALHSAPIAINLAMNAVVKVLLGEDFSIMTANSPLKTVNTDTSPSELSETHVVMLWFIVAPIGMLFLMSSSVIFPIFELSTNFVQTQIMAGVYPILYWLTNVFFDFLFYFMKLLVIFIFVVFLDVVFYDSMMFKSPEYQALLVIFVLYIISSLPFAYLFGYKHTVAGGFSLFAMIGMFVGIVPTIIIAVMEFSGDEYYVRMGTVLKYVFLLICPQFSLSYLCAKFARKYVENYNWAVMDETRKKSFCLLGNGNNSCCFGEDTLQCQNYKSYFKEGAAGEIIAILSSFLIYLIILWFLHTTKFKRISEKVSNASLKNLIHSQQGNYELQTDNQDGDNTYGTLRARKLKKSFGGHTVVRNVSIKLPKKSCFGLLGVNGAGKSTTFRMLTKDTFCDDGEIELLSDNNTIPIKETEYSENIGYCPQQDALNYQLTGKELLKTMAMLRGFSFKESDGIVAVLLKIFELNDYGDKPCLEYSGGNKRKLSAALAFVGLPDIILLDEPTSGVDPASRRSFWNTLSEAKKQDVGFLLCSHSMEECEALCDKIAIMKNGVIKAEGSLLQLKEEHQKGFTVSFKLKSVSVDKNKSKNSKDIEVDEVDSLPSKVTDTPAELIRRGLKNAELKDEHGETLYYLVRDPNKRLSEIFREVEELKGTYDFIEDYTISQTSLEDVFLSIARHLE